MEQCIEQRVFCELDKLANKYGSRILLAVSGGGDSLALAKLCFEWQKKHPSIQFSCAIIDHKIAANSHEVAQFAASAISKIGLDGKILEVSEKITPPYQENARIKRFSLLTQYAHEIGAQVIMLGHNLEDQIETLVFRMQRRTGLLGLSCMDMVQANYQYQHPIIFIRPLLGEYRQNLRDYLLSKNIEYFDDPANENTDFSRVKIRNQLKILKPNFAKLLSIINKAREFRTYLNLIAFDALNNFIEINDNQIAISRDKFLNMEKFSGQFLLSKIFEAISNSSYPINSQKLQSLFENLQKSEFKAATLANMKIERKKDKFIIKPAKPRKEPTNQSVEFTKLQFILRFAALCNQVEGFLRHQKML